MTKKRNGELWNLLQFYSVSFSRNLCPLDFHLTVCVHFMLRILHKFTHKSTQKSSTLDNTYCRLPYLTFLVYTTIQRPIFKMQTSQNALYWICNSIASIALKSQLNIYSVIKRNSASGRDPIEFWWWSAFRATISCEKGEIIPHPKYGCSLVILHHSCGFNDCATSHLFYSIFIDFHWH